MTGTVGFRRDGLVGIATIDRPERKNALDVAMCEQFIAHLETNTDCRAVVVRGAGDVFCAGADLGTRVGEDRTDTFRAAFEHLQTALEGFPAPLIAAIDGPALGAGTQMLTACDIRIAGAGAKFGIPAARLGLVLSAPNLERLVRVVGQAGARDLLFTARVIDANNARALGLVQRVAESAEHDAVALAGEIAQLAPMSVQGHKHALGLLARATPLPPSITDEMHSIETRAFASDDLQEGVRAFSEKRSPEFRGR